jgi:hypothetical protein
MGSSRTQAQCNALSAADAVCASYQRPRVAVCIAGAARTLPQAVVWKSLRTNLLDAYGGEQTRFAFIKLEDANGHPNWHRPIHTRDEAPVRETLGWLGVKVEHMHIEHVRPVPYPPCNAYNRSRTDSLITDDLPDGRPDPHRWGRSHEYFESLLGQLDARKQCYEALLAEETSHGMQFDLLVYTRPDLSWPMAVRPHCLWSGCVRKDDWVWLGIRRIEVERALMQAHRDLYSCRRIFTNQRGDSINSFIFAGWDACRSDNERVSALITRIAEPAFFQSAQLYCTSPVLKADLMFTSKERCFDATFRNPCANARSR